LRKCFAVQNLSAHFFSSMVLSHRPIYPRITRIFANFLFLFALFALFADDFVRLSARVTVG
jgi:hypothetical protein